jgi:hypothetical protein
MSFILFNKTVLLFRENLRLFFSLFFLLFLSTVERSGKTTARNFWLVAPFGKQNSFNSAEVLLRF